MLKIEDVQRLRQKTGFGVMDCRRALQAANGDLQKAQEILQKSGAEKVFEKRQRETKSGIIESYAHHGKIGVLLELLCETDFVAKNQLFKELAHDLVLQIASMAPADEKELLKQPFIKDESKTISELIAEKVAKTGENIKINRFQRWEL